MGLYYSTVNDLLKQTLDIVMSAEVFNSFRLVGGTALSLQLGHRLSVDIDLFSDLPYGDIDFGSIDKFLESTFSYTHHLPDLNPSFGKSYTVGMDKDNKIKLDVFYADPFVFPLLEEDGIRMAARNEILAMKIDVIQRGGRKKDFWDIHALLPFHEVRSMLNLHSLRYPYTHDEELILNNFVDFTLADDDFDPICLHGKHWEFIKEDITDAVNAVNR